MEITYLQSCVSIVYHVVLSYIQTFLKTSKYSQMNFLQYDWWYFNYPLIQMFKIAIVMRNLFYNAEFKIQNDNVLMLNSKGMLTLLTMIQSVLSMSSLLMVSSYHI